MMCDPKEPTQPYASEQVSEIALDSLSTADCLLIKTANSTYSFMVVDPKRGRGVLRGGALGSRAATTVLLGAEIRKGGQVSLLLSKVHEGSRAIFFVASRDGVNQLITSPITGLVCTRAKSTHHRQSVTRVSGGHRYAPEFILTPRSENHGENKAVGANPAAGEQLATDLENRSTGALTVHFSDRVMPPSSDSADSRGVGRVPGTFRI